MTIRSAYALALAATLVTAPLAANADEAKGPVVFAAASMKTALDSIAAAWTAKTGKAPVISYASSGVLAKQIQSGAPADLFISADQKWMDTLAKDGVIKPGTREALLGNALVPRRTGNRDGDVDDHRGLRSRWRARRREARGLHRDILPGGIYGKEALTKLGVWPAVEPKLAQAENVRAALLLVARGEAKFGIVYATDAKAEPKVKVVDTFPEASHTPNRVSGRRHEKLDDPGCRSLRGLSPGARSGRPAEGSGIHDPFEVNPDFSVLCSHLRS